MGKRSLESQIELVKKIALAKGVMDFYYSWEYWLDLSLERDLKRSATEKAVSSETLLDFSAQKAAKRLSSP